MRPALLRQRLGAGAASETITGTNVLNTSVGGSLIRQSSLRHR